jgi:outer membrane protein assembly factor BamB
MLPLVFAIVLTFADPAPGWPEYRGPTGDGHAAKDAHPPLQWSEEKNVVWKTAIHGLGWSSPVVWGDQVWLTTATTPDGKQQPDPKDLFVLCLDRRTGRVIHDRKLWHIEKPGFCHAANTFASCTPAIEAGRVYVHFGSYGTACLDTATGKTLWERRDLPCDHYRAPGASPVLFEDLLIVAFDGYDRQYVVALDKATGATRWQRERNITYGTTDGDHKKAYATGGLIRHDGRTLVVLPSASATAAYDAATGEERWRVRHAGMNSGCRPVFAHGLVFFNTGDMGTSLIAARIDGQGDQTNSGVAWKVTKGVPQRASPTLVGDHLFLGNDGGVLSCLNAKTGEVVWQQRMAGSKYWASPVLAAGRLYFFDQEGGCAVIAAEPTYRLLAFNRLADGCNASPAVVGNHLIVRTKSHLYCLGE